MNPTNLLAELKRRNVIRAAGLYLVGAWLVTQVASTLLPAFEVPGWIFRALIITLAAGFIPAVIFSWVFELTPQGLRREQEVPPEQSITPQTGRRMDRMIIVVLVLALGYFAFDKFVLAPRREAAFVARSRPNGLKSADDVKSIAVLPFENLSDDKANAYFAEGIHDEILTRLSKIAALKVISRTSTQKYKSAPDNLREVGRQLGVANLLEGSVQKAANAVHINVQLIKVATDEHLWAESYDRELQNIFGVEGEVANAIADQLNAKLTGSEKELLAAKPTSNPQAYDAYLRGLALYRKSDYDFDLKAEPFLAQAVRLDPGFAIAWALLARVNAYEFFGGDDTSEKRRAAARETLDAAVRLQPDLAEVQLAQGYYQYHVERDYNSAARSFKELLAKWPNNSEILEALGFILRRQGNWEESGSYLDRAVALDPLSPRPRAEAGMVRYYTRDFATALREVDEALSNWPENVNFMAAKAIIYQGRGQLSQAEAVLAGLHPRPADFTSVIAITNQARFRRNYTEAIKQLDALLQVSRAGAPDDSTFCTLKINLGDLRRLSGDAAGAKTNYLQARDRLLVMLKGQPSNSFGYDTLAQAYAGLDDPEAAIRNSDQAIRLVPITKDALEGGNWECDRARILARFGDRDRAIPALEHLLNVPSYLTPAFLRLDPDFDPIRGDPRFEKLCQESTK